MWKIYAAAVREYKVTALTPAFFIGAVIVPAVIWGLMFAVGAAGLLSSAKPPMEGRIAVVDSTPNQELAERLAESFSPEGREEARRRQIIALERQIETLPEAVREEARRGLSLSAAMSKSGPVPDVDIVAITPEEADLRQLREQVRSGEYLALIVVTEQTIQIPVPTEDGSAQAQDPNNLGPSQYRIDRAPTLDPDYLSELQQAVHRVIQDARYTQANLDPATVMLIANNAPQALSTLVTERGDNAGPSA